MTTLCRSFGPRQGGVLVGVGSGSDTQFVQIKKSAVAVAPGKSRHIRFNDGFNGRLRDELLNEMLSDPCRTFTGCSGAAATIFAAASPKDVTIDTPMAAAGYFCLISSPTFRCILTRRN